LLLVAGAAYFAWEHEQGRHGRPHMLCPLCWLNKIAPAAEAAGGSGPAGPPGPPHGDPSVMCDRASRSA